MCLLRRMPAISVRSSSPAKFQYVLHSVNVVGRHNVVGIGALRLFFMNPSFDSLLFS